MSTCFRCLAVIAGALLFGITGTASAQTDQPATISDSTIVFIGFIIAVILLGVYIARNAIFAKRTEYDDGEFDSKKDKTKEKYSSDWQDDYADQGVETANPSLNLYNVLGLERTASASEIKLRYRELVKKHHPDRTGAESEELVRINEAYETLSDVERRRKYDESRV